MLDIAKRQTFRAPFTFRAPCDASISINYISHDFKQTIFFNSFPITRPNSESLHHNRLNYV